MREHIVLGTTPVSATNEDFSKGYEDFSKGYKEGYLRFIKHYQNNPLTDVDVCRFLIRNTLDILTSDRYRAGYIMGWSAALHRRGPATTVSYSVTGTQQQVQVPA